jgi:galactose mutarotase-like enzyme
LLWPATGVTISAAGGRFSYTTDNRLYEMPMHGFVRTQPWDVLTSRASQDSAIARLGLTDSDRTRTLYPFGFRLQVEYRVDRCGLQIHYQVAADSDNRGAMPFSIGNHITFRLPLVESSSAEETRFQTNLPQEYILDSRRVFTGRTRPSRYSGQHRVGELPHRRAISLGGDVDRPHVRVLDPSGLFVTLSHRVPGGVPARTVLFNLWADLEEGFFSPEPWIGAQNSLNSGYGLVSLQPGQNWNWHIRIQPSTLVDCDKETGSS